MSLKLVKETMLVKRKTTSWPNMIKCCWLTKKMMINKLKNLYDTFLATFFKNVIVVY